MVFTVTTSYQISMWTQANPAFNDGAHFRFTPLQTSHLTSNLICQHPIFCLILFSCSWVDIAMVWTRYMLDTALPIISMLCGTEADHQHWDWMNKYSTVNCWSLPSCYLVADIENNLPVNPLTFTANAHTCSPEKHQTWNTSIGDVKERGFWSLWWQKLTTEPMRMESWCRIWCEKALRGYTATLFCVWRNEK